MGVQGNYPGGVQTPKPTLLTATDLTDIYTATDDNVAIGVVIIVNEDSSAREVTLKFFDGTTDFAIYNKSVPATDTVVFDVPIKLRSGHKIKAQADAIDVVTITPIALRMEQGGPAIR